MNLTFRISLLGLLLAAVPAVGGEKRDLPKPPSSQAPVVVRSPEGAPARSNDKTYEQISLLVDALDYVRENYVDEPDVQQLIYGAADGMVRTLDPFSQFMEPGAHREIKAETEGQFGGIGVRLSMKDEWLTVLTPLPGTPAYRLGLRAGDRIIEIDAQSAKDLQVADAMEKLRGAPGTKVKIAVVRWPEGGGQHAALSGSGERLPSKDGGPLPAVPDGLGDDASAEGVRKEFEITRENIKIESVQQRKLDGQVGYLRIIEFNARTTEDFREAMGRLAKDGLSGLVLDLRYNPGGLLASAVDVASSFLGGNKLIVYTQGRRPESRQEFRSGAQAPFADLPLVVLVNEGSASGAEIIAGALQDHRRALLMGARTYGKASVQSVIPLPDGSGLRLTVARYYTPEGRSIQRDEKKKTGGVAPDIAVPVTREIDEKLFSQWEMIYEPGRKPRSAVKKEEMARDEALERAVELIKARDALGRIQGKGS